LLLLTDKNAGKAQAVQGAKALITNEVLTEGLKYVVREKRPNSDSKTSFPSGHTSAAFTMATVITGYHPKYGWLAYGTAAAIGWSRVDVRAHHWWDVVAGAGLGCAVGSHYTHQHLTAGPGGMKVNWRF
jgi:membrane-associated phospholipid phosphatase